MIEKKELKQEELKKVSGGGEETSGTIVDRRDEVNFIIGETNDPNSTNNDGFYGPAQ